MKRWFYALLFSLLASPAFAATGNINLFFGEKELDSADWTEPYNEQDEFGILFDFTDRYWPVSFAIDLLGSSQTVYYVDGDRTISTSELDLGARKIFELYGSSMHPYVGGGLALINARFEDNYYYAYSPSSEDGAAGLWINGGIYWTIGYAFNLGLDVRYSTADVTLYDFTTNQFVDVDAGGTHVGILLGYHW